MVTKELGLPVLLWGPLDDVFEPDGSRHTDSQCGLFGVSRPDAALLRSVQLH